MKVSTWLPKHAPLPRTLADVPSSREKPVLVWLGPFEIAQCYAEGHDVFKVSKSGAFNKVYSCSAGDVYLYSAPTRPTKLEDVPDRRVVVSKDPVEGLLYFRLNGQWFCRSSCCAEGFAEDVGPGADWQLTDHVAELVETEIGVVT